jgi:hypothetical protein
MSGKEQSLELIARGLDLAARTLDITASLTNAISSKDSLFRLPLEIGQWLGREKLDAYELENCLKQARGKFFPNDGGLASFEAVGAAQTQQIGKLIIQPSGSLGRLMVRDPDLHWMISTVICLFQCHNESFVSETLVAAILRSNATDSDTSTLPHISYRPAQILIQPVVQKLVSSIWFNVVNAQSHSIPLPDAIRSVCDKGHYLDSDDIGVVICALQKRQNRRVILRSDGLLLNVVIWILMHYHGLLTITVDSKIIHKARLGNMLGELEMRVKSNCSLSGACPRGAKETYRILEEIQGEFEQFFSGCSSDRPDSPPRPVTRQPLYQTHNRHHQYSIMGSSGIRTLVQGTAQSMMRWMLGIRVSSNSAGPEGSNLGFTALLKPPADVKPGFTVGDILHRVPALVNLNWGNTPAGPVVFSFPEAPLSITEMPIYPDIFDMPIDHGDSVFDKMIRHFPILLDLMAKIRPHCSCITCPIGFVLGKEPPLISATSNNPRKQGCLQWTAAEDVLLLLAQGIADAFNVADCSGIQDADRLVNGMTVLLHELCRGSIRWNTWFRVAASVFLGCPFRESSSADSEPEPTLAAIQFGDLSAVAPWLDLSQNLKVFGCFKLIGARGRIGVMRHGAHGETRLHRVESNFAVVETEETEDTLQWYYQGRRQRHADDPTAQPEHDSPALTLSTDSCNLKSDFILVSVADDCYRLLLRVQSDGNSRVIDPSDAMRGVIKANFRAICLHELQAHAAQTDVYGFDELLGVWCDKLMNDRAKLPDGESCLSATQVLSTCFKRNVSLALSLRASSTTVATLTRSCAHCAGSGQSPTNNDNEEQRRPTHRVIIVAQDVLSIALPPDCDSTDGTNQLEY